MDESRARGDRLRQARTKAQLSVAQVAKRAGYSESGVRAIENGQNGLRPDAAETFAPILGVTPAWLLTGGGEGESAVFVPIIGHVGADASGVIIQAEGQAAHDEAPIPPHGTARAVAVEVVGDSMPWFARNGSLAYFDRQSSPPSEDLIGYHVIVELEDGRVLLKRLLRGETRGLYNLLSEDGPPIENVRVKWAAEPIAIIPPKQAFRVIRRAGERQVA